MDQFITLFKELSSSSQLVASVIISVLIMLRVSQYNEYKAKRRHQTIEATMSFAESVLKNIHTQSTANTLEYLKKCRPSGRLTVADKKELAEVKLAAAFALTVEVPKILKSMIKMNGYYWLIKNGKPTEQMELQRSRVITSC